MCRKATFTLFQGSLHDENGDCWPGNQEKKGSAALSEDSLLERVTAAAKECQLSQNTLTAYRRTWLKLIA